MAMESSHVRLSQARNRNFIPRYQRYNAFGVNCPRRAHEWTTTASPLPSPPLPATIHPSILDTINSNPELFQIVTPIHVNALEHYSISHPNQAFVQSVIRMMRDGGWPWAVIPDEFPLTHDEAMPTPSKQEEAQFLRDQRDVELAKSRYSRGFAELRPGMYVMPIHVVPKDNNTTFRLVTNHSKEPYSLNSMVDKAAMGKVPLDNMRALAEDLLRARANHPDVPLVCWKADVAEAYRLIPMHPFWQIKQVERIDDVNYVNRCNVFGGTASQALFIAFMALVGWIAVNVFGIPGINEYSDDHFGVCCEDDLKEYKPYNRSYPTPHTKLLELWDILGVPHKEKKQLFGPVLTIIGILVDPNALTFTLPQEALAELIAELDSWVTQQSEIAKKGAPLYVWQRLAGWLNWAFNVFPLLRPCLSNVYAKMTNKSHRNGKFRPIYSALRAWA